MRLRPYLELIRLPNVFTAVADVLLGYLLIHETLATPAVLGLLVAVSVMLYAAGMVLNDVYDVEVDRRQRPHRPIPSGRVDAGLARRLGFVLLAGGLVPACGAAWLAGRWAPTGVAALLAGLIWLYDAPLKRTPLAPLAMGGCRMLNVVLGMSVAGWPAHRMFWLVAAAVGVYIVGVTWLARTEARESSRPQLAMATLVLLAGLGLMAWFPQEADAMLPPESVPRYALAAPHRWHLLWALLSALIGWRCVAAVLDPVPELVQPAVKSAILSLIVIDAAACFAVRGMEYAVLILLLLAPTLFLGRRLYST